MATWEDIYFNKDCRNLAGGDEVGRGPLAGPVVVGVVLANRADCLHLKTELKNYPVRDSKKLSSRQRSLVFQKATSLPYLHWSCAFSSNKTIDHHGIEIATREALRRCLQKLPYSPDILLYDGNRPPAPSWSLAQVAIVHGDDKVFLVSLASILAKVMRDAYMVKMSARYPCYGWAENKGYGTAQHLNAIKRYGLSPLHRHSYCRNLSQNKRSAQKRSSKLKI